MASKGKDKKGASFTRDRGTLQTRLHHARAFLGTKDRERLEILVNVPPEKLHAEGGIELPKIKKLRTEEEEWKAIRAAIIDERDRLFAKAANAPHMAQRKDPIGRAWFEGLLDGHGLDGAVLRELGREYGGLYWSELRTLNATIAGYDQRIGRPDVKRKFHMAGLSGTEAARFEAFESVLKTMGHQVRRSVQKLCVDDILWSTGPEWLDRCIQTHRASLRARGEAADAVSGPTALRKDAETLAFAIQGLVALAVGVSR